MYSADGSQKYLISNEIKTKNGSAKRLQQGRARTLREKELRMVWSVTPKIEFARQREKRKKKKNYDAKRKNSESGKRSKGNQKLGVQQDKKIVKLPTTWKDAKFPTFAGPRCYQRPVLAAQLSHRESLAIIKIRKMGGISR